MSDHESLLEQLRQEHGEVAGWVAEGQFVAIAGPKNPNSYKKLVNTLKNDKADGATALETFALECVVYPAKADGTPDREAVKKIFGKKPAFALSVAARAQQLAGSDIEELGKG